MLPKALFLSTIEKIRQQEARIDEFDKALSKTSMTISAGGYTKRRMPVTPYPGKKPARKSLLI